MDIYEAIAKIEQFLEAYGDEHGLSPTPWAPVETRLLPSGDDSDHIKVWFNFGASVDGQHVPKLLQQFEERLLRDHPDVGQYTLEVRGDAF